MSFNTLGRLLGDPGDAIVTITDTLSLPGDFLLHHWIQNALRTGRKVYLVAISHGWSHYSAVAKRMGGMALQGAREKGDLVYIDILSRPGDWMTECSLEPLEGLLAQARDSCIIIDDLMALHWLGVTQDRLVAFVEGLESALEHGNQVVQVVHTSGTLSCESPEYWCQNVHVQDTIPRYSAPLRAAMAVAEGQIALPPFGTIISASDETILRHVVQSTHLLLSVLPLAHAHGKGIISRDVHGELRILTTAFRGEQGPLTSRIRQGRWHFRALENTVEFFARGESRAS